MWQPFCLVAQTVPQPPLGDCLKKYLKFQNPVWQKWRAMKLNTVHAKILEWMLLANRYLQWKVLPTGIKDDFKHVSTTRALSKLTSQRLNIIIKSMSFKGNYFSAPWNSNNSTQAVCDTICVIPLVTALQPRSFYQASRKLRVMFAAKQPPKLLPCLVDSLAMPCLRSGTMDEQSLINYCVSTLNVVLPVNTVTVAAVAAICWEICAFRSAFLLPSFNVPSFILPLSSSHLALSLANHSVLHKR